MKKFLLPILGAILVVGMATIVWASVIGTPHDLAPEPCAMCHTPHHATGEYPLWNRTQADQTYILYESYTFDMGPTGVRPPAGELWSPSSLCLVCHNGVFSQLVNYPGPCSPADSAYDLIVRGCAELGTDLTNDHPIAFVYDDTKDVDGNLFPPAAPNPKNPSRYEIVGAFSTTPYFLYGGDGTVDGKAFECATCHSVHDLANYPGKGDYQVYFLRNDNTGSLMCRDCHTAR
ncbi:MAG: hypothetical protein IBX72_14245 [Nitrospirae bacterium]|nr:hypothetical protein [Nitrospirota bacterium]